MINANAVMAAAEQATALSDWGGDTYFETSFRRLFTAMANSLSTEAELSAAGRHGALLRLSAMAETRLLFINDRKKWPGIAQERIVRPVFILGLPRAGSTYLHSLLGQDPANRHPQTWEMFFPSPPPEEASYEADTRVERTQRLLDAMGLSRPEVTDLHPFGARLPEECHHLMEWMALGDSLPGLWRMSGFNKARAQVDLREGYLIHRMGLQQLQHRFSGTRWVIKNPGHVFYLDNLLAVYPDALIIQTHRDPVKILPSVAALLVAMRRGCSDAAISAEKIAAGNMRAFPAGRESSMQFRAKSEWRRDFTTCTSGSSSTIRCKRCGTSTPDSTLPSHRTPKRPCVPGCIATLSMSRARASVWNNLD